MKNFLLHARMYILRGLLAVIPLLLSLLAIRFIYVFIDKRIIEVIDRYTGYRIPGLGLILVLIVLYFIGLITSNVLGRRIFNLIEDISNRIPLIKTIYQVGKQVSNTLSLPEKQVFKKAVLVEFFRPGDRVIGFITGTVVDNKTSERILKVFVPTVPNPTSGFLVFAKESNVIDPQWTVEEAMKMVISGGIIGPPDIH
ncbi:MAG: DUF502 domain-containing protein [Candidatus Omnitrophota bacterium]|nr:DUF502 domain-containing protein [Candidatus Omnitrophota bacterium]